MKRLVNTDNMFTIEGGRKGDVETFLHFPLKGDCRRYKYRGLVRMPVGERIMINRALFEIHRLPSCPFRAHVERATHE